MRIPRSIAVTAIIYAVIFCFIPPLRYNFLRDDHDILFWILFLEHLVMFPITIFAVMASLRNMRCLLSFCLGAITSAALLFLVFVFTAGGMSDRGMGIVIFLIFPLAEALVAIIGVLAGLVCIFRKARICREY